MRINSYDFNLYVFLSILFLSNSPVMSSFQSSCKAQDTSPELRADKEKTCDVVHWLTNGLAKIACECTESDLSDSDDQRDEDLQEYQLSVSVQDRIKNIENYLKQQNKK